MSKGLKVVLGVVAAVAIPFVAPVIAGALGASALFAGTAAGGFLAGAGGSALVGAGLGAAGAAATGQNPLLGAALGGVGGFTGGGGFSGLFGGGAAAAPAATAATTTGDVASALSAAPAYNAATQGGAAAAVAGQTSFAGAPLQLAGGAGGAAATTAAGASLSSLGSNLASGINPSNLAQLALVMYGNSNTEQLDTAQRQALRETAQAAATNRGLFEQRVNAARALMQSGQANPEQAFGQTQMGVQRQLADVQRGSPLERQQEASRRASIEGTRLGVLAAERENQRAAGATQTAAAMLPTQAPLGAAGLSLPIYQAMQRREDEQLRDLARAVGGTRSAGLFGSSGLFG